MQPAPFYAEAAKGPPGGQAFWLTTEDGVRIRAGLWPARAGLRERGTVFLFPGRTEYIEKYGPSAGELAERGYVSLSVDWRGQGLADRPHDDRLLGHVEDFGEYQADIRALLEFAEAHGLPRPFHVLAHSMGGCIGLRALHEGVPFQAAVFSAPLWGALTNPYPRQVAWALGLAGRLMGRAKSYAPGRKLEKTYVLGAPFEGNTLTSDPEMYAFLQSHAEAFPEMMLGGPSVGYAFAVLNETRALARLPAPDVPALTFLGTNERIVDTELVHWHMERWENGQLEMFEGAEHEVPMELPEIREPFHKKSADFFDLHGGHG